MAAAAAAAASVSGIREPVKDDDNVCVCQALGGIPTALIDLDETMVSGLTEAADRSLVARVATTVAALFVGKLDSTGYTKEVTDTEISLMIKFPPDTCIDLEKMTVIKRLDEDRVRKVWAQPQADEGFVGFCVSIWRYGIVRPVTVLDVVLVRRLVGDADEPGSTTNKRRRGATTRR